MPQIIGTSKSISGFDPRSIPACALWLDAADQSTITLSGTSVTQMRDKSSNSYTLTGSSGTYPTQSNTLNGLPVISTAVGKYLSISSFNQNFTTGTCFMVMRPTEDITPLNKLASGYPGYLVFNGSGTGAIGFGVNYANQAQTGDTTKFTVYFNKAGTGLVYGQLGGSSASTYNPVNTTLLMCCVMSGTTTTNASYVNGSSVTLAYNASGTFPSQTPSVQIFGHPTVSFGYDFAECILYGSTLGISEIQQIEGYLAWKWGLETIPQAPAVPGVLPSSISGLSLWLDGADPAGTGTPPANGATVSTWVDKSGNGYNATVASSRIGGTFNAASNCVYFQASNVGYVTSYPANPTSETMFVVFNNPSPSSANNIIIGGQRGARSLGAGYSAAAGTGSSQVVGNLNNEVAWLAATTTATSGYYLSGTTAIVTSQFTSSSNSISLNGGTVSSGGAPAFSNSTTTYLGVDTTTTIYYYIGYAMEIIFYNSILTTAQCQNIQAYLSTKWGAALLNLNGYTPLLNSPLNIPRCVLWLDAADTSTITGTTTMTAWQDKSSNAYTANSFSNSVAAPSLVSNAPGVGTAVQYSAGNGSSIANFVLAQTMSIFEVYYPINQATDSPFLEHGPDENANSGFYFHAQNNSNFAINSGSGQVAVNSGNVAVSNTWQLIEGINPDPASSSTMAFYVNGQVKASGSTQSGTTTVTRTLFINGRNGTSTLSYNTYLAELIIFSNALNTTQRQAVERYLSLKWGLSNFYTSIPGSVRGLMVWLDGADTTTMTFPSGSNISQWRDKAAMGMTLSNTISGQYPTRSPGRGIFFSNTSGVVTSSNQGFRYDGNWAAAVPTQAMSAFISYTALCNDQYRAAIFISGTNGGAYSNRPNFWLSFECGNAGGPSSVNQVSLDLVPSTNTWGGQAVANSNTFLGPRIDAIISRPGASSGWVFTNNTEMSYVVSNTYTSTYQNYMPNLLYVGAFTSSVWGNRMFHGYINEILFYSNALTTSERAVVQSYLARKWSNTTIPNEVLPLTHPFTSIRPFTRPFAPVDISGCVLWLDAGDESSITLSSTSVTQWNDKSGNSNNATQSTSGNRPTYSSSNIYFNGASSNYMNLPNGTLPSGNSSYSIFFVVNYISGAQILGAGITANNQATFLGANATNIYDAWYNVDANGGSSFSLSNATFIGESIYTADSNRQLFVSGTLTQTFASSNHNCSTLSNAIGGFIAQSIFGTFYAKEIIYYNTALTNSQRQQVEGYLRWKWGSLTYSIPSSNPFYKFPSSSTLPFLPINIGGCVIWCDASQDSSLTDLSRSGTYTISTTGQLKTAGKNGLNTVTLTTSQTWTTSPTVTLSAYTMFWVGRQTGGTNARVLQSTTNNQLYGYWGGYKRSLYIDGSPGWLAEASADTEWDMFSHSRTAGGAYTFNWYGTSAHSSSSSTANNLTGLAINTGQNYSEVSACEVGEIILYNRVLSTYQIQQVEGYLAWKWGI